MVQFSRYGRVLLPVPTVVLALWTRIRSHLCSTGRGTHEIEITAKVDPLRHDIQRIEEYRINFFIGRRITQLVAATRQADGSYAVQANMDRILGIHPGHC